MLNMGVPELLIIAAIIILLFGSRRLPEAARSLGRSMRIFKSEVKEMSKDDEAQATQQAITQQPVQAQPVTPPQPVVQPTQQQPQQPSA
ncbi:twin-arginine translocase TatA/TatE family subunit [Corynebacterium sp. 13CS0277]|uniref:Sec-independent protein translocase subunit TatA n=1 Tax=Corynebacterium sp. 13CS0277 TaxID=2071994 RepID=UPI000D033CD3|nr:Sec-independent protein translocase subunit TatA [Corynebacterium sp. 13CS0277]PRQ12056.1 twin-arginine translocase TatA/TatE family subunit [Corynebacterium sp. 13CS0277]